MTDREAALRAQIESERAEAYRAIEEAYKAGWNDCTRNRLVMTSDSGFLRWVQKRADLTTTQRVQMVRQ